MLFTFLNFYNQVKSDFLFSYILAGYPFNLERKQNFYLFPMLKLDEKTGFWAKKRFLVAILKFSDETGRRFLELLDVTIQYHRTLKFAISILKVSHKISIS